MMTNPDEDLIPSVGTGYIPYTPQGADYIKDVNSPLGAVIPLFDYRTVRPVLDLQKKNGFETWGCVSWSALEFIEEYLNMMRSQGVMPPSHEDFLQSHGYIVNNLVVFSKAFIWILSGTQYGRGNDFKTVADKIRHAGLIPQGMLPFNPPPHANWLDVFVQPNSDQLRVGQEFLQYFDIGYHFISDQNYLGHMKDGPIQIAIGICPGYGVDSPVQSCSANESHSVLIDFVDSQNEKEIVDHYNPQIKLLSSSYLIPAKMQYVVTLKDAPSKPMYEKVVKKDGTTFGVRISTPDVDTIVYVTAGPEQWKAWSKPDSYNLHTVNSDGTPDFTGCTQLPF